MAVSHQTVRWGNASVLKGPEAFGGETFRFFHSNLKIKTEGILDECMRPYFSKL